MMKSVKNAKFDTRLPFHYDVKMAFFHFLTFQRNKTSNQVIFLMLEWHKKQKHFCLLIL